MRRTLLLFVLAALLGTAVAGLPAIAASPPSEVKLEVNENCYLPKWPCWNIKGNNPADIRQIQPFTIAQGGTLSFEDNDPEAPTDVIWKGAAPSCTADVPQTSPVKTGWSGTCTFSQAGEYTFESEHLFNEGTFNYTKYKVIVEGSGTTSSTSTSSTTTTTTTTTPTTTTTTTPSKPSHSSPLEGGARALELARSQHGPVVRGSIEVSKAGSRGRLEVVLFAQRASLAKAGHRAQVRVGRFVRSSVSAGKVSFTVSLDTVAKRALRRHHKLALTVKISLTPQHGAATMLTRTVVLHA